MKAWRNYSKEEKRMVIIIGVLLLAVLLSFGRVNRGWKQGFDFFYSSPQEKVDTNARSSQEAGIENPEQVKDNTNE